VSVRHVVDDVETAARSGGSPVGRRMRVGLATSGAGSV